MTVNITKPTVGGSVGSWGTQINTAFDSIVTETNRVANLIDNGTFAPVSGSPNYEPVGGLSNRLNASALFAKRTAMESGTAQVKWLVTGSSVAGMKYNEAYTDLVNAFGGWSGTVGASGGSNSGSPRSTTGLTTNSTSGTVTDNTTDFANWWTGLTTTFGASGSRTYGSGGSSLVCDHIDVIYVGGTGVLGVQVDAGSVVNIDTSGITAGTLGFYSVTPTRGAHTVTLTTVSGTPKIVTVGMWDGTQSGLLSMGAAQGGISLTSATANAWTNYTTFLAHYLPDVITWEMKSGQWTQAALNAMLTAIQNGAPNCDVILLGGTPDSGGAGSNATQVSQNKAAQATALTYQAAGLNVLSWDGYTPLGSYARVTALGWQGDGTHLAWQAQQFLASLLMRDLGIYHTIAGRSPFDVRAQTVAVTGAVKFQKVSGATGAEIDADPNGNDLSVKVTRWTRGYTADGVTEAWRLDNAGGGTSFLPSYVPIGSGNPAVAGDSATALGIRTGGNYRNLQVRRLMQARTAISTSGAVSCDLTNYGQFELTLTGNVTSFGFANADGAGELVWVHFIQDATGSRTLSSPSASIKWAGGSAPTLTTTAGRRDIFAFQQISGSYYEVYRSMNVG